MGGLEFHPTIVERPRDKLEAIAAARAAFARGLFDEGACELETSKNLPNADFSGI